MSDPSSDPLSDSQSTSKTHTLIRRAVLLMFCLAVLACVFVIIQSCSWRQQPSLMRFARGSLHKLQVLPNPPPQPALVFRDGKGMDVRLSDDRGRLVLLNVWASWCPPCVREMPSLDALQAARGGDHFVVRAISLDSNIKDAQAFYKKKNLTHLSLYQDPSMSLSAHLGSKSIPISVLYDKNGREIARITGEVNWQSREVQALLDAVLPDGPGRLETGDVEGDVNE